MPSITLIVGPLIVLYLSYKYLIHPIFISPLSKVPSAHWSSSFSSLWILWKRFNEQENAAIHAAHMRYGDVVRLGPNEASVACVDDGIRTVYSGGFEKWAWYENQFNNYGVPNMFAMTESKPHSIRKRLISNVYSKSYLQSSPELHVIAQEMLYSRLLPLLANAASKQETLDVLELNFATTLDFIVAFIFGLQNASNILQDTDFRRYWLKTYQAPRRFRFWNAEVPGLISLTQRLGIYIVPKSVQSAYSYIEDWTYEKCKAAQSSLINPPSSQDEKAPQTTPIVYAQLASSLQPPSSSSKPSPEPSLHIATEVLDHLAAGHETSGITLTYLMHELSLHPSLQTQLRQELLTLSPPILPPTKSPQSQSQAHPHPSLPSPRDIDALPLLHALLMETLRLHAAIPGPQPRITPQNGCTLASHTIPGGCRVSSLAYTLHRNSAIFPNPEEFKPERWLQATDAEKTEMGRWFWAFGSGGRMCVGSNFAVQEMKLIIAGVYSGFETRVVDDAGIEQVDAYTAGPRGNRLLLRLERVES